MTVKKMEGKPNMALSAEDEVRETMTSKRLRVRIGYGDGGRAGDQRGSGDVLRAAGRAVRVDFVGWHGVRARRLRQKAGAWCADCAAT